jgi:putative hemolysin
VYRTLWTCVACAALLAACSKQEPSAPAGGNAPATAAAPAGQPATQNGGKVVQSQNGGGYTYAEVQLPSGQKVWVAGSAIDVKPGTEVQWGNFAVMRNFDAKSLGKTFPEILFVDRWAVAGQAPVAVAPHGSFPNPQAAGTAPAAGSVAAGPAAGVSAAGTVRSVTAAGGYSYIEVDQGGKTVWVAAMETPMKKGDTVRWQGGSEMANFTARSLGRTFDRIIFAQEVTVGR